MRLSEALTKYNEDPQVRCMVIGTDSEEDDFYIDRPGGYFRIFSTEEDLDYVLKSTNLLSVIVQHNKMYIYEKDDSDQLVKTFSSDYSIKALLIGDTGYLLYPWAKPENPEKAIAPYPDGEDPSLLFQVKKLVQLQRPQRLLYTYITDEIANPGNIIAMTVDDYQYARAMNDRGEAFPDPADGYICITLYDVANYWKIMDDHYNKGIPFSDMPGVVECHSKYHFGTL
jgi:hypothetical protein